MKKTAEKKELFGKEGMVLLDTIRRLTRRNAKDRLLRIINKTHPADLAWVFRHLTPEERSRVFSCMLRKDRIGPFLTELDQSIMVELVSDLSPEFMVEVLKNMPSDDAADLLEALPEEMANKIKEMMASEDREEVDELLQYDPDSAGGLMSPDFLALDEELTVGDAITTIQALSEEKDLSFYLYVTRGIEGLLTGVLSLRELLLYPADRKLKDIMNPRVIAVSADTDQEEVAHLVSRYNILAVPVIDSDNKLIGIITVDDVIDVIREEATEDFLQMAGAGKDQEILLKSTIDNALTRAPWLFASWIGGIMAAMVISFFEEELQQVLALAAFIPIVMGMGGNIGTQSSTIVVRGIATGRVNMHELWKIVFKETRVGFLLGCFYGLILGIVAYFTYGDPVELGLVVGFSILFAMILAATVGTIVPLVLKKLNIDAAVATGPFVTTSIDILGVVAYFLIAKLFLGLS
ncbi:MAG: magnesium transporter [Desulfurivibrionaceae bacterium]